MSLRQIAIVIAVVVADMVLPGSRGGRGHGGSSARRIGFLRFGQNQMSWLDRSGHDQFDRVCSGCRRTAWRQVRGDRGLPRSRI